MKKHSEAFGSFAHSLNIGNDGADKKSRFNRSFGANADDDVVMVRSDVATDRDEQIDLLSTFLDNEVTDLLPELD